MSLTNRVHLASHKIHTKCFPLTPLGLLVTPRMLVRLWPIIPEGNVHQTNHVLLSSEAHLAKREFVPMLPWKFLILCIQQLVHTNLNDDYDLQRSILAGSTGEGKPEFEDRPGTVNISSESMSGAKLHGTLLPLPLLTVPVGVLVYDFPSHCMPVELHKNMLNPKCAYPVWYLIKGF